MILIWIPFGGLWRWLHNRSRTTWKVVLAVLGLGCGAVIHPYEFEYFLHRHVFLTPRQWAALWYLGRIENLSVTVQLEYGEWLWKVFLHKDVAARTVRLPRVLRAMQAVRPATVGFLDCSVSIHEMEQCVSLSSLRYLYILRSSLTSGDALSPLSRHPTLEYLSCVGSQVHADANTVALDAPRLRYLDLRSTSLTAEDVAALRAKRRDVYVRWP